MDIKNTLVKIKNKLRQKILPLYIIFALGMASFQLFATLNLLINHKLSDIIDLLIFLIFSIVMLVFYSYLLRSVFNASFKLFEYDVILNDAEESVLSLTKKHDLQKNNKEKKKIKRSINELNENIKEYIEACKKYSRISKIFLIIDILYIIIYHMFLFAVFYSYYYNQNPTKSLINLSISTSSQFYIGVLTSSSLFLTVSIAFIVLIFRENKNKIKPILSYSFASFIFIFSSLFLSIIGLSLSENLSILNPFPFQMSIFLVTLFDFFLGFILILITVFKAYTSQFILSRE